MDDLLGALSIQSKGFRDTKDIKGTPRRTAEEKKKIQEKIGSKVGTTVKSSKIICQKCEKEVFVAEKIEVEVQQGSSTKMNAFHKGCFRCFKCDKKLDITNWTSHQKSICCKNCSRNLLREDNTKKSEQVFVSPLHQQSTDQSQQKREQEMTVNSDEEDNTIVSQLSHSQNSLQGEKKNPQLNPTEKEVVAVPDPVEDEEEKRLRERREQRQKRQEERERQEREEEEQRLKQREERRRWREENQ